MSENDLKIKVGGDQIENDLNEHIQVNLGGMMYYCSKCLRYHRGDSRIGKKHRRYGIGRKEWKLFR